MANRNTPAANEQENSSQTPEESAVKAQDIQEQIQQMQKIMQEQKDMIDKLNKELVAERSKAAVPRRTDKARVQEAIQQAIAEGKNTWDVKIPVRARPRQGTTEKHYWLGVNGRFLAVPADDKYYDLSLPFAECLVNAMDAEIFVKDYADKIQVHDLISNPHEEEKEM